ncbi:cbb3-type cytochrome c oxidase N-terminal domain-containing protein [Flavitalea flava]
MLFRKKTGKTIGLLITTILLATIARAGGPPPHPSTDSPFVIIMIIIIIILALAISLLANVLLGAAQFSAARDKASGTYQMAGILLAGALFLTSPAGAQVPAGDQTLITASNVSSMVNGLTDTAFYTLTSVVFLEMLILLVLLYNLRFLLSLQKQKKDILREAAILAVPPINWWEKFNRFKPLEQEISLDLGHDYDGIRELDNRLPPWWLYGFYCTILFACVYMWRYHVSHSAPSSSEEYQIAMQQAEIQKTAYLKKAANNIDENSVKLLTGADQLAPGKAIFESTCFPCHGKAGEGGVGPNLTDEYWLHGGSIQEIFKTIKYGWPEKGMKSWKDDYSPSQIAQITSYVKSLGGTHPPNPKPPQGTISK